MTVTKDNQEQRANIYVTELKNILYRRYKISQEIEQLDKRIAVLEGALQENESVRRDLNAEAQQPPAPAAPGVQTP